MGSAQPATAKEADEHEEELNQTHQRRVNLTSFDSRGYGFASVGDVASYVAKHGSEVLEREEVNTGFEIERDVEQRFNRTVEEMPRDRMLR